MFQTVLDLLNLTDRYGFESLKNSLSNVLRHFMDQSNVLQLMTYADVYNSENLFRQCAEYVDSNAQAILHSHSMMILPKEHLKSLLQRDSFVVSEIEVFVAVKKWKKYNNMENSEMEDVLRCVRLTEIPTEQLETVVHPSGLYPESVIKGVLEESCQKDPRGRLGI